MMTNFDVSKGESGVAASLSDRNNSCPYYTCQTLCDTLRKTGLHLRADVTVFV